VSLRSSVLSALGTVRDPELDEPITTLGFVGSCVVSPAGEAEVHLRLPTPQCAPNFAFLMAADARAAVLAVPGVTAARVELDDHYTGDEINGAVAAGGGLEDAFPGETEGDVRALRDLFRRKALLARQGRLGERLLAGASGPAAVVALRVADLPPGPETARCLELRAVLGLPAGPEAPALVAGDGDALSAAELPTWLRRARLVSLSLESNGGICRSLLRIRHGVPDPTEELVA
jgi:metal-sulfur cluster biosynthetic enzyme